MVLGTGKLKKPYKGLLGRGFVRCGEPRAGYAIPVPAPPSPPVIESSTQASVNSSTITLTKPSGVQVGDLLLLMVDSDEAGSGTDWNTTPTGFTKHYEVGSGTSDNHIAMFYKIADGSEGATVNVVHTTTRDLLGFYVRVSGANTAAPIDATGASAEQAGSTSHSPNAVTTTQSSCLCIFHVGFDGAAGSPFSVAPVDWVKVRDTSRNIGASGIASCFGYKEMSGAESSGQPTISTGGYSNDWASKMFAIAPTE